MPGRTAWGPEGPECTCSVDAVGSEAPRSAVLVLHLIYPGLACGAWVKGKSFIGLSEDDLDPLWSRIKGEGANKQC